MARLILLMTCLLGGLVNMSAVLAQPQTPPPSVMVSEVHKRDITPTLELLGRVEARDEVALRARIEGVLEQRNFEEGGLVEQDQLLFVIEKRPFEVQVQQAKAELASAQASLKNAQANLRRLQELHDRKLVSAADLDTAQAEASIAEANVLRAQAALESAELSLSYTEIRSPIRGRISGATYSVGNLVGPGSEPLATVFSFDPIHVSLAVSDKVLLNARQQGIIASGDPPVAPSLVLSDGSLYPERGRFDYLAPEVDRSTDTVQVWALFPNSKEILLPGQFVNVLIRRKQPITALMVPQTAVQQDKQGFFVLVVNRANQVEVRRIVTDRQVGNDWVVESGLAAGERVIVQGVQKVQPDMSVNPVTADEP
ncbi:efflux RND transporter periplasmic adaptor subunit [Nitrosococcus oceani]|uniref:efflux RND transporter periplasmic adaptor subunit n=1 Tax=Nitrosococcus oceani TaxID=1229 RepID=UPI0004E87306|nr:efflux RND transporter periplasmic adaptor subunit [Nitrosococcus oceani]KFI23081.1 hemolysin D [Nitrosococcus oceani]